MEADAGRTSSSHAGVSPSDPLRHFPSARCVRAVAIVAILLSSCSRTDHGDALARVKSSGTLVYGSDQEGGGPYIFPDPEKPSEVTGFEVEMMRALAREVGAEARFLQGQWDRLLQDLDAQHVDVVVNGYEWTEPRARKYLSTRPYYVYQLQLLAAKDGPIDSWEGLTRRRAPGGKKWRVGVLVGSAADTFAGQDAANVEVVRFDGATDAMTAAEHSQIDATLQDLPAAIFYKGRFPGLKFAGSPVSRGYYVLYFRPEDRALRDAVDGGIGKLLASGDLKRLYERYGIWNDAQIDLAGLSIGALHVSGAGGPRGWGLLRAYLPLMVRAALVTVGLSLAAMPLAMLIGLFVALGRLYGPTPLRIVLGGYVELLRGTPLMLQLYVLYYLLELSAWQAGILGLAINYSAYEAEIYRAGLQAIPPGQMEAALALGMSRGLALRRVVVPQAMRIVIPPVTNDFIAMFKDTSVCSVITLVELTKQYSILANSTGGVVEFALAASALYLAMSLPLSWFSRWSEQRLAGPGAKGGAQA